MGTGATVLKRRRRRSRYRRIDARDRTGSAGGAGSAADAPTLTLERWELVATGDQALLHVAGRWEPAPPKHVVLVRCTAEAIDTVEPLPPGATTTADGAWTVGFAIDPEAAHDRLLLWPGAGSGVALPTPRRKAEPLVGALQDGQATVRAQAAPPAGKPCSAVDQDLLDRIARAKALAGQD